MILIRYEDGSEEFASSLPLAESAILDALANGLLVHEVWEEAQLLGCSWSVSLEPLENS